MSTKTRNRSASRPIRISCGQLPAEIEGKSFEEKQRKSLRKILSMIRIAGKRKSDLVLFGEYSNLYHRTWSGGRKEYVPDPIPGSFTRAVCSAARKYHLNVAVPMFGVYKGRRSSYVVLVDRTGKILDCYQKTHPTMAEQRMGMIPGDDLAVYDLDFGRVGIMTCMDIEYPEVAQVLMLKGAEMLLFPHVQAGWGEVDWEIRYRARAVDTGLPVVSACYGFPLGGWSPGKAIGRSGVIGRDGGILADIGRAVGVITCDLDLAEERVTEFFFTEKIERTLGVRASRRPELYRDLTDNRTKEDALRRVRSRKRPKN